MKKQKTENNSIMQWLLRIFVLTLFIGSKGTRCGTQDVDENVWLNGIDPSTYVLNSGQKFKCFVSYQNADNEYVWISGITANGLRFYSERIYVGSGSGQLEIECGPYYTTHFKDGDVEVLAGMDPTPAYCDYDARKADHRSSEKFMTWEIGSTEGFTLTKFSGDSMSGDWMERLSDTVLYKLRVQVIDNEGVGQNQIPVTFETNQGYFITDQGNFISVDEQTKELYGYSGIAEVVLWLNNLNYTQHFDYVVEVSNDNCWNTVVFHARCVEDNDPSNLYSTYTHKLWDYSGTNEILGDLHPDGWESFPDDKTVKIEIDYDVTCLTPQEFDDILTNMNYALLNAKINGTSGYWPSGIDVEVNPNHDYINHITPMSDELVREYLAQYRNHTDHIHCILGTRLDNQFQTLGKTMCQLYINPFDYPYEKRAFLIGHKSSGLNMQDSLDRTGCAVFLDMIREIANDNSNIEFEDLAGVVLAHEIGHCLQMGHTFEDSFDVNVMDALRMSDFQNFNVDDFSHFILESLDDTWTVVNIPPHGLVFYQNALSTREQLGVHTTGYIYFDREEKEMIESALIPFLLVNQLNGCSPEAKLMSRILDVTQNASTTYSRIPYYKGSDFIINYEKTNEIGVAWIEGHHDSTWRFNYMRFDTTGSTLVDLRNLAIEKDYSHKFDLDWHKGVPYLECTYDERSSCVYFVYSYEAYDGFKIKWKRIASSGNVIEEDEISPINRRRFITGASSNGFHLFLYQLGFQYYNSAYDKFTSLKEMYSKPYPYVPRVCIDIDDANGLFIGHDPDATIVSYQIISAKGHLIETNNIDIAGYTSFIWHDVDLPYFGEIFRWNNQVVYLLSFENTLRIIQFGMDGKPTKPQSVVSNQMASIKDMSTNAQRFMKVYNGCVYYIGIDDIGNLYLWNSKYKKGE